MNTRFNPWEKAIIRMLHARFRRKLLFASFVTVETQASCGTPGKILELVKQSADDLGQMLSDPAVAREVRETVVSVGTVLEHTIDRDGRVKLKHPAGGRAALSAKWRALPNALQRFVVRALSSEEEDAQVPRAPVRGAPACLIRRNLQRTSGPACLVRRNLQRTSGSFVLTEPRRAACPGRRRRCGRLATPSRRSRSRCASRSRGTSRPRARRTRRRPGAPRSRARHMR